jgi:hypothetical protein
MTIIKLNYIVLIADPAPAPEYFCQQPRAPSLPFSPPPRARLALWRVMVGGVWGARAWWCVCGGGRDTCTYIMGAVVVVPAALALLALPWHERFSNVGVHNAATPRDFPPLPRSPSTVHRAGLFLVGGGSYASCPTTPSWSSWALLSIYLGIASCIVFVGVLLVSMYSVFWVTLSPRTRPSGSF